MKAPLPKTESAQVFMPLVGLLSLLNYPGNGRFADKLLGVGCQRSELILSRVCGWRGARSRAFGLCRVSPAFGCTAVDDCVAVGCCYRGHPVRVSALFMELARLMKRCEPS